MTDTALAGLARAAGLAVEWTDSAGKARRVNPDVLRAVVTALGFACGGAKAIADSLARLRKEQAEAAPLSVVSPGAPLELMGKSPRLDAEDGSRQDLAPQDGVLRAPRRPGYYTDENTGRIIAVRPARAFHPAKSQCWGIGVQLYALRGGTTGGFGDFAALAEFSAQAAARGADALAISPVHALFSADPSQISPYAPSTRLWLNPLYAALDKPARRGSDGNLVDWEAAAERKWRALHRKFERFDAANSFFQAFVKAGGERLLAHARFEVLDARFRAQAIRNWRSWPEQYRSPATRPVGAMSAKDPGVAFQLFAQWLADKSLGDCQAAAKANGMGTGLIADMAVGMAPSGSHAWSAPDEVLDGLAIGAPPDLFNRKGQNWGLTNFAPHSLSRSGYRGFIATLRACMRHAGGIRLDHAMGLQRLWVIPQGADPVDGVYLYYPVRQMLGLLALESHRHQAMVVAEDLGTVPQGFRERIARAGLLGMRVLWFERDAKGDFIPPEKWDRHAAALSTTHDLPTLAGWWKGCDIAWRGRLGMDGAGLAKEKQSRVRDRRKLWRAMKAAGHAKGAVPVAADRFVDAAFAQLAATPCPLKLFPVEDFIGASEQPNIPGTTDEHPNWRRRLAQADPLAAPAARRRAAILNRTRP